MKSFILLYLITFNLFASTFKGVWLRPAENSKDLREQIRKIKETGFNAIFLETFYHGFSIVENPYIPIRPSLADKNILKTAIEECKKHNIELHLWIQTFYWQVDTSLVKTAPYSQLMEDDMAARLANGNKTGKSEYAHNFANPLHKKVRYILLNYIKFLITNYEITGIHLDYIRYHAGKEHSGYDTITIKKFYDEFFINPRYIKKEDDEWKKWVEWRENIITNFVGDVRDTIKKYNTKVILSAAIFGDYYLNRYEDSRMQDWSNWCKNGYVDFLTPMAYSNTLDGIEREVNEVIGKSYGVKVYTGFASPKKNDDLYGSSNHPELTLQLQLNKRLKVKGYVIFCWNWMEEFYSTDKLSKIIKLN